MGRKKKTIEEKEVLEAKVKSFHFRCDTVDDIETAYNKVKSVGLKPVKKMQPSYRCVVSTETRQDGTNPHIHAKIDTNMTIQTLRARLLLVYQCSGNDEYSLAKEKKDTNLAYVIKCGVYKNDPEFTDLIRDTPKWVFKVQNDKDFDASYALLEKDYLTAERYSDYYFVYNVLELYSKYKKHIYVAHIRAKWLGVANQRNKALDDAYQWKVGGTGRPFRHRLVEEIMRGFLYSE